MPEYYKFISIHFFCEALSSYILDFISYYTGLACCMRWNQCISEMNKNDIFTVKEYNIFTSEK